MSALRPRRVMWLLNHGAARRFEIPMLKRVGYPEIYLPKIFPDDVGFRSASVDYAEDSNLTIDADLLNEMNTINWHLPVSRDLWKRVSRHFDIAFFTGYDARAVESLLDNFEGAALWRAYGLSVDVSYTYLAGLGQNIERLILQSRQKFWLAEAYQDLRSIEAEFLARRAIHLPLGLAVPDVVDRWEGSDKRIMFVCPDIVFNPYYRKVYEDFKANFGDLPHVIGGAQPLKFHDPHVLGFVSAQEHQRNMRSLRAMFYHSQEPRHVHFHPFEAVQAGMPLVFMAGGLLDRLGGRDLPGRADSIADAHDMLKRLLDGDPKLTTAIKTSQTRLLAAMMPDNCVAAWQTAMTTVTDELDRARTESFCRPRKVSKIAVILPVEYRGGTLRGAKLFAEALVKGAKQAGEQVEVVFAHLDDRDTYPDSIFGDLHGEVSRRVFQWRRLDAKAAQRAMTYAGFPNWRPLAEFYLAPDDRMQQFGDCDLWIVISDRLSMPLLPIRPYALMVYDYLQRYVSIMPPGADRPFLLAARSAKRVFVTTDFTRHDAIQYAGVAERNVIKLPMLVPEFDVSVRTAIGSPKDPYFLWATNAGVHKNHKNALLALKIYYEELGGVADCKVCGVNTGDLLEGGPGHLLDLPGIRSGNEAFLRRIEVLGELSDADYKRTLARANFLWHPGSIDNGTFGVVEAARFGVPALSSDYPAMREMNEQFSLSLAFMNPNDVNDMARALKRIELNCAQRSAMLPTLETLQSHDVEHQAAFYWEQVRRCL